MEPAMVAAALEVANKDVIDKLTQFSLETSPSPLGWRFMEKIIQLPITIPPPTDRGVLFYLNSLTSAGPVGAQVIGPTEIRVKKYQQIFREAKNLVDVDQLTEKLSSEASAEERPAIAEASNQRYIEKFSDRDPAVRQLVELATAPIGRNPRQIKRYINVFRFYAALRRVLKNEARAFGATIAFPSDAQLAKFITLMIQWPHALDSLRISSSKLTGKDATQKGDSLLSELEKASRAVKATKKTKKNEWTELLKKHGLPTDGWLASDEFKDFLATEPTLGGSEGCGLW